MGPGRVQEHEQASASHQSHKGCRAPEASRRPHRGGGRGLGWRGAGGGGGCFRGGGLGVNRVVGLRGVQAAAKEQGEQQGEGRDQHHRAACHADDQGDEGGAARRRLRDGQAGQEAGCLGGGPAGDDSGDREGRRQPGQAEPPSPAQCQGRQAGRGGDADHHQRGAAGQVKAGIAHHEQARQGQRARDQPRGESTVAEGSRERTFGKTN